MSTGPNVVDDQQRIRAAHGDQFQQDTMVLTSRDELAIRMMNRLSASGLEEGFHGLLIPLVFESPIEIDVVARVGATTGEHDHDTAGFHQILNGTVRVTVPSQNVDVYLGPGDWVWIPRGVRYTFEVVANPFRGKYRH